MFLINSILVKLKEFKKFKGVQDVCPSRDNFIN